MQNPSRGTLSYKGWYGEGGTKAYIARRLNISHLVISKMITCKMKNVYAGIMGGGGPTITSTGSKFFVC